MKKTALFVILVLILSLSSCDDFFGSSWGSARDYDYDKIDVTVNNWEEWNERAVGNPELAAALQKKLGKIVDSMDEDDPRQSQMRSASVNAAIKQSGLGTLLLSEGSSVLSKSQEELENLDQEDIIGLLTDVEASFKSGGGVSAANSIGTTLTKAIDTNTNTPTFSNYTPTPAEAGQAAVILALALSSSSENGVDLNAIKENPNMDLVDFFKDEGFEGEVGEESSLKAFYFDEGSKKITFNTADAIIDDNTDPKTHQKYVDQQNALALAAMLNTVADSDNGVDYSANPITDGIRKAFLEANKE